MAMFDQTDATNILKAILNNTAYTTVAATNILLGTSVPTATAAMSELAGGTGYTTGGSTISWSTAAAAASANSNTVSWTNTGSSWSIQGLEIWNSGVTVRHLFGTWTGGTVTVTTGNTFQVATSGITVSLVLCDALPVPQSGRATTLRTLLSAPPITARIAAGPCR